MFLVGFWLPQKHSCDVGDSYQNDHHPHSTNCFPTFAYSLLLSYRKHGSVSTGFFMEVFSLMLHFCTLVQPAPMGEQTKGLLEAIFQNAPIVPLIASKYTWAQLYADIVLAVG